MALYDTNNYTGTPWYAPAPTNRTSPYQTQAPVQTTYPAATQINQFVWINNPSVVDMWPVAAGSEMTFINNETMRLYVKRVDEYNHPLKVRIFKLVEETDEETATDPNPPQPAINMEELKSFLSSEVDRAVSNRFSNMFASREVGEAHG